MAYIGLDPNVPLLNTSTEFFSGNGSTKQFTLSRNIASASDLDIIIGTVAQRPGVDYTAENTTLLFDVAPTIGSNNIVVTYRAGALNSLDLTVTAFPAGTVGAPGVYSVAANNTGLYWANASSLVVTTSGVNTAAFNANRSSTSNTTGALTVEGGIGATGNINTSGIVRITNNSQSSNVATGALIVSGGVGVSANLNVAGNIICAGDFTVNGNFTTTGTDSLDVADPFIFLADDNPGDALDTGVVAQYFDGTNTRYTGYFRDITDGKYKFFSNLLVRPTNTVSTADPSFVYTDVLGLNLSATGNVVATSFIGDGSQLTGITTNSSEIFNSNSKISIPSPNGNIVANVNNQVISTIAATGLFVNGVVSASGNIAASSNVSAGNISSGGLISSAGNITSSGNITGGNVLTTGTVSAGGNVTGANITTSGAVSATGSLNGSGLSIVTGSSLISQPITITQTWNNASGTFTALRMDINTLGASSTSRFLDLRDDSSTVLFIGLNGTVDTVGNIVTTANVRGGNIVGTLVGNLTGSTVSVTGNVTGNYFLGNGALLSGLSTTSITNGTSNVRVLANANVTVQVANTANVLVAASTGLFVTGLTSSTGNVVAGNLLTGGFASVSGNVTANNITSTNSITGSVVSISGNVTGGNLFTGGLISATGNLQAANLITGGLISAFGTVSAGNLSVSGSVQSASVSASGNVTGGNLVTNGSLLAGGTTSATGNITGGNIVTGGLVTATGNILSTANVSSGNIIATSAILGSSLSVSGNITADNASFGNIVTAANAAADTNTNRVATTAFVVGQASSVAPANIGVAAIGTSLKYARADHTHNGVFSVAVSGTGLSATTTSGAVTVSSNANTANSGSTLVARDSNGNFAANVITATISGAATTAGTVTGNAQSNITSVGTLTSLTVSGNASVGNLSTGGQISASGIITTSSNISANNITGTLTTANQPNITTIGTLVSVSVSGNAVIGNITTGGLISATGNITGGNILGNGRGITSLNANSIDTGTLPNARLSSVPNSALANSSLSVNGTAISLGGSGTVTANTPSSLTFNNTGSGATSGTTFNGGTAQTISYNTIGAPSTSGTNASGTWSISITGSANVANTVATNAQPNITSVGILSSLSVSGAITVNSANAVTAIINGGANGVGNIGSATAYFNTGFLKATTAQYADLAENYIADAEYAPGTVLDFGGIHEVTISRAASSTAVAGVVSTDPAHLMNSTAQGEFVVALALQGRVPTQVVGPVKKGALMVSDGNGRAMACSTPAVGTVIGKAIEDFDGDHGVIEVVVGRP